ncbi:hypothetical protein KUTeg_014268 [Tegillarca granosa]|uniref:EF-hand domain-containing protein n=1 Tax=Tegillarca granosa TaxID=220873 RepID=A0ABQ9EW34_TEGGR|nr:hypothetical protein KUTeg_014268 [Tegillarca granosa]
MCKLIKIYKTWITELFALGKMDEVISEESSVGGNESRNGAESSCSESRRRTPSCQGSAKFHRTSSEMSTESVDHKMAALQALFKDKILLTEISTKHISKPDIMVEEDGYSDIESEISYGDGRTTQADDYETDLEINYDEWVNEDKIQLERDEVGDKKYIHVCNEEGVIPVTYFLKHIQDTEFVMRFHGLGPLGAKAIAFPLKSNRTIRKINLEGNWIGATGCEYIAATLKDNLYVSEIHLGENRIGNAGAEALCDMLLKNDLIHSVDISGNDIDDNAASKICAMLLKNSTVRHIHLAKNRFEDRAAVLFKDVLSHNETLETIDLSWNHFRTRGAVAIAEGVQENYGLKVPIEGALAIANGLQTNDILKKLKDVPVTQEFFDLATKLEKERIFTVLHGGIMGKSEDFESIRFDPLETFRRDPMTVVQQFVKDAGYRMYDLFKEFDRDQNMVLTEDELIAGLKRTYGNNTRTQEKEDRFKETI